MFIYIKRGLLTFSLQQAIQFTKSTTYVLGYENEHSSFEIFGTTPRLCCWPAMAWFKISQKITVSEPIQLPKPSLICFPIKKTIPEPLQNRCWKMFVRRVNGSVFYKIEIGLRNVLTYLLNLCLSH